jgi:hypothetical protein
MSERSDQYWDYAEAAWVAAPQPPAPQLPAPEVPSQRTALSEAEEADVRSG